MVAPSNLWVHRLHEAVVREPRRSQKMRDVSRREQTPAPCRVPQTSTSSQRPSWRSCPRCRTRHTTTAHPLRAGDGSPNPRSALTHQATVYDTVCDSVVEPLLKHPDAKTLADHELHVVHKYTAYILIKTIGHNRLHTLWFGCWCGECRPIVL